MSKNSLCYPGLPEEEIIPHHFNNGTESNIQFEKLPENYGYEFEEPFLEDNKAGSCSQSHRQAEKRRRDRINAQLARLRRLIPKSDKMDKAALLERVVHQIKDLKRTATEIGKFFTIPTETDDIKVECHTNNTQENLPTIDQHNNNIQLIKATFCCEDRPDLIPDIIRELKDLNLTIVGAEIACLGGRLKSILLLYYKLENANHSVCGIEQSLMGVLNRVISWSSAGSSNFRVTSKRQRFFCSS